MNKKEPKIFLREEAYESEMLSGETKKYVKSETKKIEQYGFFIRLIHEHFIPCQKCQLEIKTILQTKNLYFHRERNHVILSQFVSYEGKRTYEFELPFVAQEGLYPFTWKSCLKCQKEVAKLFDEADQITIGNKDYLEPVELWMKFEIDDNAWKTVEERPSTQEEQERLEKSWFD